jgi:hypothetical protein
VEGSSPEADLERGMRRFGLAAVVLSSKRWLTVRAINGRSPTALNSKTESSHHGEGPRASGEAWGTMIRCDSNGARALLSRWGKAAGGRLGASIYRPKSPIGAKGSCDRDHKWNKRSLLI